MHKIKVLIIEPDKIPYVKEIENTLESLQKIVCGYIQAIYPFNDQIALICNEEGKLNNLPLNRPLKDDEENVYDIISGTFIITGIDEDDFSSLSDELLEKYALYFLWPHIYEKPKNMSCIIDQAVQISYDYISFNEMKEYGYSWWRMMPISHSKAKQLWKIQPIYALYSDNTESLIESLKQLEDHYNNGGIFGYEIEDYIQRYME